MKQDRLFALLYLLLENGSTTAPELAQKLEVSLRTVYRDVDALSMAGLPICTISGKGGGISLLPGYRFDKALLSDREQNQLLLALQSLQAADQTVEGLTRKLETTFQKSVTDWISVDFSRWGMQRTDTERFEQLKSALLGKQVLQIEYCSSSGETAQRQIHPLRLVYKDRSWYLQAHCLRANDFRLFKLGRILSLTPTGDVFEEDYSNRIPPIEPDATSGSPVHFKLRISSALAFRVYDEFQHDKISKDFDGNFLVEADFPMDPWVQSYLLSFGLALDVLEPPAWNLQLATYAKTLADHYKHGSSEEN